MKQKLAIAALAILCALLAWSNVRSYLRLPTYQTIYRVAPTPYYAKPSRAWEKAEKVLYPCLPVLAVAPKAEAAWPENSTPDPKGALDQKSRSIPSDSSTPQRAVLSLGEFRLDPLPHGGRALPELLPTGETRLRVIPESPGFLEVGSLREASVWAGRSTWAVSYQQDILRVGPAWLRGRAEYGRLSSDLDTHAKVEFGIAVRF